MMDHYDEIAEKSYEDSLKDLIRFVSRNQIAIPLIQEKVEGIDYLMIISRVSTQLGYEAASLVCEEFKQCLVLIHEKEYLTAREIINSFFRPHISGPKADLGKILLDMINEA